MLFSVTAFSQTSTVPDQKMVVNASDLTPMQIQKINADKQIAELQKKLDTYGNWVGVGGEIGTAVKEGLTAVVDVADKFGKTDVGKFTLLMVAWKVMGQDVVRIVLGLLFFAVAIFIEIRVYKSLFKEKKVLKTDPGFFKYPKEYEVVPAKVEDEEALWTTIVLCVFFLITIWITYAIMF